MKKSLVALAVLAASGAAMAQSSVTLYGRLDASVGQSSTETVGATAATSVAKLTQTGVLSSAANTTYWGIKGVEDLGGGLKAVFQLESKFAIDTGAAANTLFEREARVGFVGSFGEVQLGRLYPSFHSAMGDTDMLWDNNFSVAGTVSGIGVAAEGVRVDNAVRYDTPNFNGLTGSVTLGFGENKNTPTNVGSATDHTSFNVKYVSGPLMVMYGHQENKLAQATAATPQVTNKYDLLGGTYDFGAAKVNVAYNKAKNGTNDDTEYQVGVTVPLGAFSVGAGYSKGTTSAAGVADLTAKGYAFTGYYALSSRTSLYAGYMATEVQKTPAAIDTVKASTLAAGVRHVF